MSININKYLLIKNNALSFNFNKTINFSTKNNIKIYLITSVLPSEKINFSILNYIVLIEKIFGQKPFIKNFFFTNKQSLSKKLDFSKSKINFIISLSLSNLHKLYLFLFQYNNCKHLFKNYRFISQFKLVKNKLLIKLTNFHLVSSTFYGNSEDFNNFKINNHSNLYIEMVSPNNAKLMNNFLTFLS